MKRTFAILLCALLLIPAFAVCASANEVYTFDFKYSEALKADVVFCNKDVPDGMYIMYFGDGENVFTSDPIEIKFEEAEIEDGVSGLLYNGLVALHKFPAELSLSFSLVKIFGITLFDSPDLLSEDASFRLVRVTEEVDPLPSVNDTLDTCINWVGQVLNAMISGELNGLLLLAAIPIAITVVMLSIKFIRRNSWGC